MLSKCPEFWLTIRVPTVGAVAAIMALFSGFVSTAKKELVQHASERHMNTRLRATDVGAAVADAALAWKMWNVSVVGGAEFDTSADYTVEFKAWHAQIAAAVRANTTHTLAAIDLSNAYGIKPLLA